jgi:hypothetical protein
MHVAVQSEPVPVSVPVGEIKTFGPVGDRYQVVKPLRPTDDGDWMVLINRIESGEEAEYRLSRILNDPKAV